MIIPLTQILIGDMKPEYEDVISHNTEIMEGMYELVNVREPVINKSLWKFTDSEIKALICDFWRFRLASQRDSFFYADLDCKLDTRLTFEKSELPYFPEYSGAADSFIMAHNGAKRWFQGLWENMKYKMYVYSWQRKTLRNIDFNVITGGYEHPALTTDDA